MRRYNRIYAKIDLDAIDFNLRSMEEKISDPEQIVANVYRTKFRGFPEETNTRGYALIAEYMKNNADVLYDEATKG